MMLVDGAFAAAIDGAEDIIGGLCPGYYNFNHHEPKAPTAKVKAKSECAFCHIGGAKRDEVWTQFYRILDEVPLPKSGKG
jgi:hypothetical protein